MKKMLFRIAFIAIACTAMAASSLAQKVTPEEIIAKHLESIGKADDRTKMFNVTAVGTVGYSQLSNASAPSGGKVVFASEANKALLAMTFQSSGYQGETIKFDGKDDFIGFSSPGKRTLFGDYLYKYKTILKHNLIGGVLQKGWPFADVASRNVKLSSDGTKKVDGRDAYVLAYEPKKGSDIRIRIYFDKENFRHVRTEYLRTNQPGMGHDPNASSSLAETHENLTEDFSEFKTEYGVTLPRKYKITLYSEANGRTYEGTYTMSFTDFYYNSKLEAGTFDSVK
jgi:outer membrane lipoprotein-sorting protein